MIGKGKEMKGGANLGLGSTNPRGSLGWVLGCVLDMI